jgi:AcrR family transcriptional regulator
MTAPVQQARKVGRPRSEQSHQAILEATLEALAQEGFTAMSIEGIAARAHVGKATIYRRWSSKEDLAIEALLSLQAEVPHIDTGNLREDLIALVQGGLQFVQKHPYAEHITLRMMGEIRTSPQAFRAFLTRLIRLRLQRITLVIERAKARGEIRPEVDPLLVHSMLIGSLFMLIVMQAAIEDTLMLPTPEQIVDVVLRGIEVHEGRRT